MSFISYAQNYEDVMLWRALKNINGGFYIDAGAFHPEKHSVTKAFYDRGWRGLNIEANPHAYAKFLTDRTRDHNINMAVGKEAGSILLYVIEDTGLTTVVEKYKNQHEELFEHSASLNVPMQTLTWLWKNYIPVDQDVHFLKIDVEGFEKQVLEGLNLIEYRPWIVLLEAMEPLVQRESHEVWEYLLIENNYVFAYADGLNRYYIAAEKNELLSYFKYPPNVFDEFQLAETYITQVDNHHLNEQYHKILENSDKQNEVLEKYQGELNCTKAELTGVKEALDSSRDLITSFYNKALEDNLQNNKMLDRVRGQLEAKENELELTVTNLKFLHENYSAMCNQAETYRQELLKVYGSKSWRLTFPLRFFVKCCKWFWLRFVGWVTFRHNSRPRRFLRNVMAKLRSEVVKRPTLKAFLKKIIYKYRGFKNRNKEGSYAFSKNNDNHDPSLSAEERRIAAQLQAWSQQHK